MVQGNGAHGGYRAPTNPAAASGPGRFARRTDGQPKMDLPNAAYGENAAYQSYQAGAPLASASPLPNGGAVSPIDMSGVTPLGSPSTMPQVPVTAGAAAGPGPGVEALGLPQTQAQMDKADAQSMRPMLQAMLLAASSPSATPSFRALVRKAVQSLY